MNKLLTLLLAGLAFSFLPPCACAQGEPHGAQASEASQRILTRSWTVDRDTFCRMCSGNKPDFRKFLDYMKARGVTFPEGCSVSYNSKDGHFVVRHTQDNLAAIDEIIQKECSKGTSKDQEKQEKRQKKSKRR